MAKIYLKFEKLSFNNGSFVQSKNLRAFNKKRNNQDVPAAWSTKINV